MLALCCNHSRFIVFEFYFLRFLRLCVAFYADMYTSLRVISDFACNGGKPRRMANPVVRPHEDDEESSIFLSMHPHVQLFFLLCDGIEYPADVQAHLDQWRGPEKFCLFGSLSAYHQYTTNPCVRYAGTTMYVCVFMCLCVWGVCMGCVSVCVCMSVCWNLPQRISQRNFLRADRLVSRSQRLCRQ